MRHLIYLPRTTPSPVAGSWFYIIVPDHMHDGIEYHSTGLVERTVDCGYQGTAIEYRSSHLPVFCNRPL